jgi:hypothetical protein
MPTVYPDPLTFYKGVSPSPQRLAVTVTGANVYVTVDRPPPGGIFLWDESPPGGWLLNPPPSTRSAIDLSAVSYQPPLTIPVKFNPPDQAAVQGTMRLNIQRNDATRSGVPGFPVSISLLGNADGVGPGTIEFNYLNLDPPGPDLEAEYVQLVNATTDRTLDLMGCRVGDLRGRPGQHRVLYEFTSSFYIGPGVELRIYTGHGVPQSSSFAQIALKRGSPVWNNAGDTAWVTNPNGQLIQEMEFRPVGGRSPSPPMMATVTIFPNFGLVITPIFVEEGDQLFFASFGQIWSGLQDSGPDGRADPAAGLGYPAPNFPPMSLIGKIGAAPFFLVGSSSSLFVEDAEGSLSLGINDINVADNSGPGYTCVVMHIRH